MGSINVGKSYCHYNPQVQCHELLFIKRETIKVSSDWQGICKHIHKKITWKLSLVNLVLFLLLHFLNHMYNLGITVTMGM